MVKECDRICDTNKMTLLDYKKLTRAVISMSIDIEDWIYSWQDENPEELKKILMCIKEMVECINDVPNSKMNYYLDCTEEEFEEFFEEELYED